jgi:phosphoglycolate phosphatase
MLYIFDWDGTLCDSVDKIVRCTRAAARELGIEEPSEDSVKNIIGLSLLPAIQQVFPGISDHDLKRLLQLYAKFFKDDDTGASRLYPGAQSTLATLLEQGHHIAIATGKSRQGLDRVLTALDMQSFFHGSRCADETASKPDPLMLRELLEEFCLRPDDAVMIGDTEYDMDMARQLGMRRIGVSYGAHEIHRLHPYQPVRCLDSIEELLSWCGDLPA